MILLTNIKKDELSKVNIKKPSFMYNENEDQKIEIPLMYQEGFVDPRFTDGMKELPKKSFIKKIIANVVNLFRNAPEIKSNIFEDPRHATEDFASVKNEPNLEKKVKDPSK